MLLQQQQQQHRAPLVSLSIPLLLASPPTIASSFLKSPSSAAALPLSLFLVLAASTAGGLPIQQLLPQLASLRQLHPLFLHTAQHTHDTDTRSPRVGSLGRKAGRRATSRKERFAGLRGGFAGVALYTGLEQEGTFCQLSARLTLLRKESLFSRPSGPHWDGCRLLLLLFLLHFRRRSQQSSAPQRQASESPPLPPLKLHLTPFLLLPLEPVSPPLPLLPRPSHLGDLHQLLPAGQSFHRILHPDTL